MHSPGRLRFYGFSNGAGQYGNEQCLVQPLYSSEGDHPHEVSDEVNTVTWPRPLPLLAE